MRLAEELEGALLVEDGRFRVKLTPGEQATIGEFDNGNWLTDVGLRSEGGGVFSGDAMAMRRLAGAFSDRADPMDDFGLTAGQRRTAKKAAEKVREVAKKGATESIEEAAQRFFKKTKDKDGIPLWVLNGAQYDRYRDRFEVRQGPGGYAVDDHKTGANAGFRSLGEVAYWIDEMIKEKP